MNRTTGAIAATLSILIILGCMSFSIERGERVKVVEISSGAEVFEQKGSVMLEPSVPVVVYYPVPYATPPNLTLQHSSFEIIQQYPDRFVVKNNNDKSYYVDWNSKGLSILNRAALPPTALTNLVPTSYKDENTTQASPINPFLPPVPGPVESQPKP